MEGEISMLDGGTMKDIERAVKRFSARLSLPWWDLDLKMPIMINAKEQRFKELAFVME